MTYDTTDNARPKGPLKPPTLNPEEFREEFAGMGLTPEEEREVLEYLWHIVKTVVDAGFGLDAASNVLSAISQELFQEPKNEPSNPNEREDV